MLLSNSHSDALVSSTLTDTVNTLRPVSHTTCFSPWKVPFIITLTWAVCRATQTPWGKDGRISMTTWISAYLWAATSLTETGFDAVVVLFLKVITSSFGGEEPRRLSRGLKHRRCSSSEVLILYDSKLRWGILPVTWSRHWVRMEPEHINRRQTPRRCHSISSECWLECLCSKWSHTLKLSSTAVLPPFPSIFYV